VQSKRATWAVISVLLPIALMVGYLFGGFVAMVVLVVGGAALWTVSTFAAVGIIVVLASIWLWRRRSLWIE